MLANSTVLNLMPNPGPLGQSGLEAPPCKNLGQGPSDLAQYLEVQRLVERLTQLDPPPVTTADTLKTSQVPVDVPSGPHRVLYPELRQGPQKIGQSLQSPSCPQVKARLSESGSRASAMLSSRRENTSWPLCVGKSVRRTV